MNSAKTLKLPLIFHGKNKLITLLGGGKTTIQTWVLFPKAPIAPSYNPFLYWCLSKQSNRHRPTAVAKPRIHPGHQAIPRIQKFLGTSLFRTPSFKTHLINTAARKMKTRSSTHSNIMRTILIVSL